MADVDTINAKIDASSAVVSSIAGIVTATFTTLQDEKLKIDEIRQFIVNIKNGTGGGAPQEQLDQIDAKLSAHQDALDGLSAQIVQVAEQSSGNLLEVDELDE